METLKNKRFNKAVTWSLVVMFSFLQVVPTGWANPPVPVTELDRRGVPAPVQSAEAAAQKAGNGSSVPLDASAAFYTAGPLSQVRVESVVSEPGMEKIVVSTTDPVKGMATAGSQSQTAATNPVTLPGVSNSGDAAAEKKDVDLSSLMQPKLELGPIAPPANLVLPEKEDKVGIFVTTTKTEVKTAVWEVPAIQIIKVVTDPATGKGLSVVIDDHGIATVKWGEETGKGFFDSRTNSLIIVTNSDAVWTLQFAKNDQGALYIQTFQTRKWEGQNYSEETYTYNFQGQLIRKDWLNERKIYSLIFDNSKCACVMAPCDYCDGGGEGGYDRSGGTIDYVQVNGKTLVSHEKTWSESNGRIYYEYNLTRDGEEANIKYPSTRRYETETWYSYDYQGNLLARNWNSTSPWGSSFGQETYVHINGQDLVSVRRTWQYGGKEVYYYENEPKIYYEEYPAVDGLKDSEAYNIRYEMPPYFKYVSSTSVTYYNYDSLGNLTAEVNTFEGYDAQGVWHTSGSYSVYDPAKRTLEVAWADGIDPWTVRSWKDYRIIEAAAQRKTVYVGAPVEQWWRYTHTVEYTRNADGTMTAKVVSDNAGNDYIVRGEPDILSGRNDDIKLQTGQQVNGKRVWYQEYTHYDANGNWVNDGFRLVFYDASTWVAVAAVDFPKEKVVTLDGKKYEISVNADGLIELKEIFERIAIDPVADKDAIELFGAGLAWKIEKDGVTTYLDADGNPVGSKTVVKQDEHVTVTTWCDQDGGLKLIEKVEVYPNYTMTTLLDSLNRMMKQTFVSSSGIKQITEYQYEDPGNPTYSTSHNMRRWNASGILDYEMTAYNFQESNTHSFFAYTGYSIWGGVKTYFFYWQVAETDSQGVFTITYFMGNKLAEPFSVNAHTSMETAAQLADSKTILFVKEPVNIYHEYYKDKTGAWPSKPDLVSDGNGRTYIVVGDPDEIPGQGDDIDVTNGLTVQPMGDKTFTAWFQRPYFDTAEGRMKPMGIWIHGADGSAFVNFPKETKVKINGVVYEMSVSRDGVITLTEPVPPEVAVQKAVYEELAKMTGLPVEQLKALISKIELHRLLDNQYSLFIYFNGGKMGENRLIDVLGNGQLPTMLAQYTVKQTENGFEIQSGSLGWGSVPGQGDPAADLHYENGRLTQITWNDGRGCDGNNCPLDQVRYRLLYWDVYSYSADGSKITITRFQPNALINYSLFDIPADAIKMRSVDILVDSNGVSRIDSVTDYDGQGNVLVKSQFEYEFIKCDALSCVGPGMPVLSAIIRSDSEGKLLSTISIGFKIVKNPEDGLRGYEIYIISLPDGRSKETGPASEITREQLFDLAREFETRIPPEVQAYRDTLQDALGTAYRVSAIFKDGKYLIAVNFLTRPECQPDQPCPKEIFIPKPGQMTNMSFVMIKGSDGMFGMDLATLAVSYNIGIPTKEEALQGVLPPVVDARLLYNVMGWCVKDKPCPDMATTPQGRLLMMAQLRVTRVQNGGVYFTSEGNSFLEAGVEYVAYHDLNGKAVLHPAAVKDFSDQIQGLLTNKFLVTVEPDPDVIGAYLVKVENRTECLIEPCVQDGELESMLVRLDFQGNFSGLKQAIYQGFGEVDAQLLLEAMKKLEASFHPAGTAWMVAPPYYYARMVQLLSQISVTRVEGGTVYFSHTNNNNIKSYKAYRDSNDEVILENIPTPEERAIAAVKASVQTGLLNTFGFSQATLDQLIKNGKIAIRVDLTNLTATVTIDPSVTLPAGSLNLADPLGNPVFPATITFKYSEMRVIQPICTIEEGCTYPTYYYLASGSFQIKGLSYELSYVPEGVVQIPEKPFVGDNRLHSVQVYNEKPDFVCVKAPCHELVATITYAYPESFPAVSINVSIAYLKPQGQVVARDVFVTWMNDGQYYVQTVTDKDAAGNVLVTSQFRYRIEQLSHLTYEGGTVCDTNGNCVTVPGQEDPGFLLVLDGITRIDASGKQLSEIRIIDGRTAAIVINGQETQVEFNTPEELLAAAQKLEESTLPPAIPLAVQGIADSLKSNVWNAVPVWIPGSVPPRYHVTVSRHDGSVDGGMPVLVPEGELVSMSFEVAKQADSEQWVIDESTLQGAYQHKDLNNNDAFMTDLALVQGIVSQIHLCTGEACVNGTNKQIMPQEILAEMTRVVISVDDAGAVYLRGYKAYRDANGNVVVEIWSRDIEQKRAEINLLIEDAMKKAQESLARFQAVLAEAQKKLRDDLMTITSDGEILKGALEQLKNALEGLLGQDGLSAQTQADLGKLIGEMADYSGNFDELLGHYMDRLSFERTWNAEAEIQKWQEYLDETLPNSLLAYKNKVAAAQTLEDLERLEGEFPAPGDYPIPQMPPIPDPREEAKGYYEAGAELKDRALKEIEHARAVAVVKNDLVTSFGLDKGEVDALVKAGKIVISVDLKARTATITIDPAVQLPAGVDWVIFSDLLGAGKLPARIDYRIEANEGPQYAPVPCVGQTLSDGTSLGCGGYRMDSFHLVSGNFTIDLKYTFELNYVENEDGSSVAGYGDNRLRWVTVSERYICPEGQECAALESTLIKKVSYVYEDANSMVVARITYGSVADNESVASREVVIKKMEDGRYHVDSVADHNSQDITLAKSQYIYLAGMTVGCPRGDEECVVAPPVVSLVRIDRSNQSGPLSTISDFRNVPTYVATDTPLYAATITLQPSGRAIDVTFETLQDLLDQALKSEGKNRIPPGDMYVDSIASTFGVLVEDIVSYVILQTQNIACEQAPCPMWSIEVEAQVQVNGEIQTMKGWVNGPAWPELGNIEEILPAEGPAAYSSSLEEKETVTYSPEDEVASYQPLTFRNAMAGSPGLRNAAARVARRLLAGSGILAGLNTDSQLFLQGDDSVQASSASGSQGNLLFGNLLTEITK